MNEAVGHRAALIVALLLVGSLVAPLSLSRVASADDLSVTGTALPTTIDATQNVDFTCDPSGGTTPYSYVWDFGDGVGTSTDQNPSYTFPSAGTFYVTVTVTDDLVETAYWSVDITVNELPSATGTPASATVDVGQSVDFTGDPSGGSGSGYTFLWDFGDGLGTSTDQNPSYIFPSAGTFYVTVTVTDDLGGSSSPQDIGEITVNPSLSVTGTASATAIDVTQTVDFTCTPSDGTSPYTYSWSFGDSGSSTDQSPSYEYDSTGTWTAEVTVTDDVGETGYWSVEIKVYYVQDPIVILSYDDFTFDNGVVSGSGTIDDPFIIEDWDIDASGATGIDIEGTDAYFIVRNCYIHDGGSDYYGIYLSNCINGVLDNNDCEYNLEGIYLSYSSDNTLSGNTCSWNTDSGIYLEESNSNILSDNTCLNNWEGIYLYGSSGNTLNNNSCSSNNYRGIDLVSSSDNIITNNTLDSNSNIGIFLQQSSNSNTVSNNTCSNANYGICLSSSSGNTIDNNTCSSGYFAGMRLSLSSGNTISNNTCSNNYIGMILQRSNSNAVNNNTFSSNDEYGIYLYASSNSNTLRDNNCSSNDYDGMYLASSSSNEMTRNQLCYNAQYGIRIDSGSGSNTIWRNTFIDNNGANIQAYDDGTDNLWYSPGAPHGYGNYWNDWTTPDVDSNSIVDSPYVIDGSSASQDIYPLTIPEDLLTKTIKGQVRDEMDTPIPGAQVAVTIKNGEVVIVTKTTTTDADGYYAVTFDQDEWSVGYTIEVTAQYGEQQTETIEADGSTTQTVDIQFPFAIAQFGNALGFLLAGALVGVVAMIFLKRRRRG